MGAGIVMWRRLLTAGAVTSIVILVGVYVARRNGAGCLREAPHPTDDELIDAFRGKRSVLELVVGLLAVHPELSRGEGRPAERAEYERLLDLAGCRAGVAASPDGSRVEFTVSSRGFATHNSQKGYMHSRGPVRDALMTELDTASSRGTGAGVRRIEDGWYLFFEGY